MELLNTLFSLQLIIKLAGIVFSIFFFILTVQTHLNLHRVVGAVKTRRNNKFELISLLFIMISLVLFITALLFL